jgi:hypothetical protein
MLMSEEVKEISSRIDALAERRNIERFLERLGATHSRH